MLEYRPGNATRVENFTGLNDISGCWMCGLGPEWWEDQDFGGWIHSSIVGH